MHAGRIAAMLVRVTVHREIEKIRADAAVVQKRVALTGSTVATKPGPLLLAFDQEGQKLTFGLVNLRAKSWVRSNVFKAGLALVGQQCIDARRHPMPAIGAA